MSGYIRCSRAVRAFARRRSVYTGVTRVIMPPYVAHLLRDADARCYYGAPRQHEARGLPLRCRAYQRAAI